jgi:hypothetical protein
MVRAQAFHTDGFPVGAKHVYPLIAPFRYPIEPGYARADPA